MASILKRIVRRLNARGHDAASERVFVAAFGKHPGWDDHIDDIGLETEVLVAAKRIIYVQGIGGNIDSASWDKLQEDQVIKEFKHALVWSMGSNIIVGRLWSSRDGKGRTSYPMVVCVQCCQVALRWVLNNILPRLEGIERACVATTSAAEVRLTIENAKEEFRRLAQQAQPSPDPLAADPGALAKLAECPEMGPDHEGLLHILYHIDREGLRYHSDITKTKELRPTLLRVPASPSASPEHAFMWFSFLLTGLGTNTPILMLMPLQGSWMDIIIGEPTELQLYCLRASSAVIPLTNSIPYNMGSEFVDRANQLIEDSRSKTT